MRIENTLLTGPYVTTEFGRFLRFEPLTLCPIDTKPIISSMLSDEERQCLNAYHAMVYERLAPLLDEEHREWLANKSAGIIGGYGILPYPPKLLRKNILKREVREDRR